LNKRIRIRTAAIAVGVLFGLATGIGGYTFIYARGGSYLTNNPKACANCHIMQDHYQRKAQFYLDFIEAENSMGFHAPQEAARILAESIDFTRRGQKELRR